MNVQQPGGFKNYVVDRTDVNVVVAVCVTVAGLNVVVEVVDTYRNRVSMDVKS